MSNPTPPLLLESICLKDGKFPLLDWHQARMNRSRNLLLGHKHALQLQDFLNKHPWPSRGTHKVRLLYRNEVEDYTCSAYTPRIINSLKVVHVPEIDYRHKYALRTELDHAFVQREQCDDVIITVKGYITDSSYANLALFDGKHWWTPSHPLLKGVRRASLIHNGTLKTSIIRASDLPGFRQVRLINAMMSWEDSPTLAIESLVF